MSSLAPVCERLIEKHIRSLTVDIGVRLAGSPEEASAADYVKDTFEELGVEAAIETFPVRERAVTSESLEIRFGDLWQSFPCSLFSNTPGTDGDTVEAPLCFFENPTEYQRSDLSHLRGKAVVHLGCHVESRENYQRLMEAGPAFLLFVDIRYPGTTALADGMFPAYTRALGARPTVNVAYMDAWRWKSEGAIAARLNVAGGMRESESQNVVAELSGSDPAAGAIVLGGHHDTQAGSVGADDNASGVAAILEAARVLEPLPRKRTLRFVSFGAEEQLSVGSAEYVRQHREELSQRGTFMANFDSFGSHMGWTELNCGGPAALVDYLLPFFEKADLYVKTTPEVIPYTDLFPFLAAGVPGIYIGRSNCAGGRFFHHRSDDDLSRVSCPYMARMVDVVASIVHDLANTDTLPFPSEIPADQAAHVKGFWEDLFGGWNPPV